MPYVQALGRRIRTARKSAGLSQKTLAARVDISQSSLSEYENGEHQPDIDKLHDIARELGIDAEDLIGDNGSVTTSDDLPQTVQIPEFSLTVAAGGGAVIDQEAPAGYWPWPRRFFAAFDMNPHSFIVLTVSGDSMEPTLRSGDKLLIDTSRSNPATPGIYVLSMQDLAVVKRLEMIPGTKPPRIRISSDNPQHHAYEVNIEDLTVIGWVAAKVSRI